MAAKCIVCDTDLHCKVEPCEHGESVAWYCPECGINRLDAELTAALVAKEKVKQVLYQAEELLQEMVDAVKKEPAMQNMKHDDLAYKVISFLSRPGRVYP